MDLQSVMWIEMATGQGVRCRMLKEGFLICSYVYSIEDLMLEIEKSKPDVVVMDLDLYERMDGIETSWKIRNRFNIPVMYDSSGANCFQQRSLLAPEIPSQTK